MIKQHMNWKSIFSLFLLLTLITSSASAQAPGQPANSWVNGSNWYCNNGYQKSGNQCVSIFGESTNVGTANSAATSPTPTPRYQPNPTAPLCAENGSCYGDVSPLTGNPKTVPVQGYYRRDGTYVRGHYRSK